MLVWSLLLMAVCFAVAASTRSHSRRRPRAEKLAQKPVAVPAISKLISLEEYQFSEVAKHLKEHNVSVHGFYHMSRLSQRWPEVMKEQLLLMSGFHRDLKSKGMSICTKSDPCLPENTGLLSVLDKLHVYDAEVKGGRPLYHGNVTASDIVHSMAEDMGPKKTEILKKILNIRAVPSVHRYKCNKDFNSKQTQSVVDEYVSAGLTSGEYPTITALRDHCIAEVAANRQSIVFYAHLKSAGFSYPARQAYWRDAMNAIVLEFPSICIRALAKNSVCGMSFKSFPASHYSGNFWWASCNHIAKLPPMRYPLFYWLDPEMFILRVGKKPSDLNFAKHCAYDVVALDKRRSMFESKVTYADYAPNLYQNLAEEKLTPCGTITHTSKGMLAGRWTKDMLRFSEACLPTGGKDHLIGPNKPCLSLRTPPNFISPNVNYYNIDSDPVAVWGYIPDAIGGKDVSDSSSNFSRYIKETWPLVYAR